MAFGRDGSELELQAKHLELQKFKTALEQIVDVVEKSTVSIVQKSLDPAVAKIARDALDEVVGIRRRLFPPVFGFEGNEKAVWAGTYIMLHLDSRSDAISTRGSELPNGASLVLDFTNRTRQTGMSVFEEIPFVEETFMYKRWQNGELLFSIVGTRLDSDTIRVSIEVIHDIPDLRGFVKGKYEDLVRRVFL